MRVIRPYSRYISLVCALLSAFFYAPASWAAPKNIILFIGDGMSVGHVTAAKVTKGVLNLEQFKTAGLLATSASTSFIANSELSTTSMATGCVSNPSYISLSISRQPLKTVLEYAKEKGMATGLVVTSQVTDVTPACFTAHVDSRFKQDKIAEDLVCSDVDVVFGGGSGFFLPAHISNSSRKDEKNLIVELRKRYEVALDADGFRRLGTPKKAFGLFELGDLAPAGKRDISLAEMTRKAIDILSTNKTGFFLMAEASQIDWNAHRGYSENVINEMIDLDNAVGAALDFAKKSGDTLIIVASDHDTGGYYVAGGSLKEGKVKMAACATPGHTANMVPIFAYGPGSEAFGGIHDMAFVGRTMIDYIVGPPSEPQKK